MELVLVTRSKSTSSGVIFLALLIGAAGSYVIYDGRYNPLIGAGLLATAILMPLVVWANINYQKRLVINDDGIMDSRLGVGLIPWEEIEDAHLEQKYNNEFICLRLRSPEKFLARLPDEKRQRVLANHRLGFTGFNVSISGVDIDGVDLLELVRDLSEKRRAGAGRRI